MMMSKCPHCNDFEDIKIERYKGMRIAVLVNVLLCCTACNKTKILNCGMGDVIHTHSALGQNIVVDGKTKTVDRSSDIVYL